jgi:oligopeptide transport system substrate-binding protein
VRSAPRRSPFVCRTSGAGATCALLAALLSTGCSNASGHAQYFGKTVPPDGQELRYISGAEPESLDPPVSTSQVDGRIMMALFEGLTEYDPKTAQPIPALAETWEPNEDNSVFTFHLRAARWSDGSAITADDFVYSLRRGLSPALASRAAYLAYDIVNAQPYNEGAVFARDRSTGAFVMDSASPGTRLVLPGDATDRARVLTSDAFAAARGKEFVPVRGDDVGVAAVDAHTLRVTLRQPVPFLPKLVAHQFFRPVPRQTVERYGDTWTKPGSIVTSGPFTIESWRPYDAIVMKRSPTYWDAATVRLERIRFYAVEDLTTMMNLYKAGEVDVTFNHTVPSSWINQVRQFRDYMDAPEASNEAFVFNTTKAPVSDVRVRRALNMSVDKAALARFRRVAKPLTSVVPAGIFPDYVSPAGDAFDPARARALMAEAGFRNASGEFDPGTFPVSDVELTYNTTESNRSNAEFVQSQWKQNLGITIPLRNMEFRTFLQMRSRLEFKGAARSGWIADFMDPYTFLSMYAVEGGDNGSGWTDPAFVGLLNDANRERDTARRNELLARAEALLQRAQPMLPLYASATNFVKKPYVKGLYANPVTMHAWKFVYIEHDPSKWD